MSIPKHHTLSCTKGFLAQADVKYSSPTVTQSVNVVVEQPKERDIGAKYGDDVHVYESPPSEENQPYENLIKRDAELDLEKLIHEKDNIVRALSLIIDIMQNNPLKLNSLIIPSSDTLIELIKLLVDAENVELKYSDIDPDCGCCGSDVNYEIVNQILVTKENEIYNLKYQCPQAISLLEKYKINYKFVQK
ncbi:MAG: hypothetical protein LBS95_00400 [Mycoplasmataceae bacterium]|jgi:hypothetical protein|nr:hypothetical protein [Mycoplasmataceae bacterium]